MVPRNRLARQEIGIPQRSPFMPVPLAQMQQLVAHSTAEHAARFIYAILVLHADCMGNVMAKVEEIASVAGYTPFHTRNLLRRLVKGGHIRREVVGRGRRIAVWHIASVRDDLPPPSHAA